MDSESTPAEPRGEPSTHRSAWVGWTLGLVAVPVLYLLSVPPVAVTVITQRMKNSATSTSKTLMPEWLEAYVKPYDWLTDNTPLKRPLDEYKDFWARMFFYQ